MPRTVIVVADSVTDAARDAARREELRVLDHEADADRALQRVADGEADAALVLQDGWALLALPAPGGTSGAARPRIAPSLPAALGVATGLIGVMPVAAVTTARAVAAARTRRGQRTGPRPVKPRRQIAERISDLRQQGKTLAAIAEILNDEVPRQDGKRWHPATVKRVLDSGIAETRVVARRLGHILEAIEEAGAVDHAQLEQLGTAFRFHHDRLLRTFEQGWGAPYQGDFCPPIERRRTGYRLNAQGRRLLEAWRRSEELDDEVEQLLLDVYEAAPDEIHAARLSALCERRGVTPADIPADLLAFEPQANAFVLTDAGRAAAATWDRLVNTDPRRRLDIDYWPDRREEELLADDWDWEDPPLEKQAVPTSSDAG